MVYLCIAFCVVCQELSLPCCYNHPVPILVAAGMRMYQTVHSLLPAWRDLKVVNPDPHAG